MAIEETVVVELASVEVTDSYQVNVRQMKKRMHYSPDQARQLAQELLQTADEAEASKDEDLSLWRQHARSYVKTSDSFDHPF